MTDMWHFTLHRWFNCLGLIDSILVSPGIMPQWLLTQRGSKSFVYLQCGDSACFAELLKI